MLSAFQVDNDPDGCLKIWYRHLGFSLYPFKLLNFYFGSVCWNSFSKGGEHKSTDVRLSITHFQIFLFQCSFRWRTWFCFLCCLLQRRIWGILFSLKISFWVLGATKWEWLSKPSEIRVRLCHYLWLNSVGNNKLCKGSVQKDYGGELHKPQNNQKWNILPCDEGVAAFEELPLVGWW